MKTILSLLVLFVASVLPAQISTYGSPQYGYEASWNLIVFDAFATGSP